MDKWAKVVNIMQEKILVNAERLNLPTETDAVEQNGKLQRLDLGPVDNQQLAKKGEQESIEKWEGYGWEAAAIREPI